MSEELTHPSLLLRGNEKFKKFSSSHPGFVLPSGAEYRIISFMNKISPYGYLAPGRGERSREGERAMLDNVQMLLQSSLPIIRVGVADILDIAILSLVIHRLLWMLRKTSSGRVLRGILILMLSMWLSSAMHLTGHQLPAEQAGGMGLFGAGHPVPAGDPGAFWSGWAAAAWVRCSPPPVPPPWT